MGSFLFIKIGKELWKSCLFIETNNAENNNYCPKFTPNCAA